VKLKRGSTSVRRLIFIADTSKSDGTGLANLVYNTSGLVAYYFAGDLSNEIQITLATMTLGTWTSGGFVAVDNTNMPGWYEFGIPNEALDGGNEVAIQLRGAANMAPVNIYIELDAVDYQTAAFGAALASNWTATRAGYLDGVLLAANYNQRTVQVTGSNHVAADIHELQPAVITAADFAPGAIDANALAADVVAEIQSGLATAANQTILIDGIGYITSVLMGSIADAGTAAETYQIQFGGSTYTVDYSGLDATGNRGTTTRSKS